MSFRQEICDILIDHVMNTLGLKLDLIYDWDPREDYTIYKRANNNLYPATSIEIEYDFIVIKVSSDRCRISLSDPNMLQKVTEFIGSYKL